MNAQDVDQDDDFDNPKKRKSHETDPWYKRYARDFFDDTRDLTPEQRGLYNDAIDMIYMIEGPIKDDDRILSHRMCVDVRTWRRVRKTLLATGKLYLTRGCLFNKRAKEVLAIREMERKLMGRSAGDRARIGRRSAGDRPEVGPDLFENINEINDDFRARSEEAEAERELEIDSNSKPASIAYDAASLRADDSVISDLVKWHNSHDEAIARQWLNHHIATHGEGPCRQAYNKLKARIAQGKVKSPIGLWEKITRDICNGLEDSEDKARARFQEDMRVARRANHEKPRSVANGRR